MRTHLLQRHNTVLEKIQVRIASCLDKLVGVSAAQEPIHRLQEVKHMQEHKHCTLHKHKRRDCD